MEDGPNFWGLPIRWVSVLDFLSRTLDVGKNTCFDNEWQWFHNELMYRGRVIDNKRFGKVMKKATHYPQIWHVNLETLSLLSENWVDTKQKQSFG